MENKCLIKIFKMKSLKDMNVKELTNVEARTNNGGGLAIFLLFFAVGYSVEKYKNEGHF